jgi:alkyl hydroperoxide reductase subunit AhpF
MDDVIIIGGSAAGTAAGIYLARRKMKFRMISSDFGGEVATSGEIENYPGFLHTDGIELTDKFREHLKSYGIEPELDIKITSVKKNTEGHFIIEGIKNSNGEKVKYESKAVIVTTGSKPKELGVPGEKEFRGKGLSYCSVCDGPLFGGKVTVTIGGGDSANESGIMMNEIASKAYVLTKNPDMKGDPSLIARLKTSKNVTIIPNAITTRVLGDNFVTGVEYKDAKTGEIKSIECQGVLVHIGMIPNSEFLPEEVAKNAHGEVVIDKNCATSIPGLFAAGDVTDTPFKQIGIAVGQGISAALAAVTYVNKLAL